MSDLPFMDVPVAGFYQRKLVKRGIFVPVKIWYGPPVDPENADLVLDRSPRWQGMVDGKLWTGEIQDLWISCAKHPITKAEYNYLIARSRYARRWDPDHPAANPREPIDMMKAAPPVPPRKD